MAATATNSKENLLSENEYESNVNDDIYPTPDPDENGWTTIPVKKGYTRSNNTTTSMKNQSAIRVTRKNLKKTRRAMKKAQLKRKIDQYRYRWTRGEPDELLEPQYMERFEDSLVTFFRSGYEKYWNDGQPAEKEEILETIRELVTKYGLKISGGYFLKNTGMTREERSKPSVDIDMYLSYTTPIKYPEFYDTMARLFDCGKDADGRYTVDRFVAGPAKGGKQSFFRKNNIYSVYKHQRTVNGLYAEMDLVRAVQGTAPTSIIKNFDLSICMNWYDGAHLYVMDLPGVTREDTGYLNYSYSVLLLGGRNNQGTVHEKNPVTRDRVLKYLLRGYRISYMDPSDGVMKEIRPSDLLNAVERLPQNKRNLYYETHPENKQ